eukprot:scaffold130496_cov18-Tisochrysis_lutea.AAC.1
MRNASVGNQKRQAKPYLQGARPCAGTPLRSKDNGCPAAELGQDMRGRRQRSVASILGRTKLTPQQADQLMAGTAAVRACVRVSMCVWLCACMRACGYVRAKRPG